MSAMLTSRFFIEQLRDHLVQSAGVAKRAEIDAREAARTVATEAEKKEDGRVAIEFGGLAAGYQAKVLEAQQQLEALDALLTRSSSKTAGRATVGLGTIVDVASEDQRGNLERTFIVLPVGAGT
jgi:hypothetical protein